MNIGILTLHLHNNYGGILQNYALQKILKGMGHQVETIDYNSELSSFKYFLSRQKAWLYYLIGKSVEKPHYRLKDAEFAKISQNTKRFIDENISMCPIFANKLSDFKKIARTRKYKGYVVGSDQVWRPMYNPMLTAMFLDFTGTDNVKRISYAASFGTSEWEFSGYQTKLCTELLKNFDLITVRERSGVLLCHDYLNANAKYVIDPTLLLNREDYEELVNNASDPKSKGELFYYILDPNEEKSSLIENISIQAGMVPFTVMPICRKGKRTKWDVKNRIEDCVYPTVTSWLRGFIDAKMVIVDSFHGAVFSIIFNKPFWVIQNSKRGNARFESLLGMFKLENRMISTIDEIDLSKDIKWEKVNEIRSNNAEKCISLLLKALN